jgi:carboxyl-terminal processing protease
LDRAVVAGHRSYGKGLVQQTRNLPYNTMIKLTTSKYYIPSGRCIQKLDYSHKDESGKATMSVDSLSKKFKTKNGRDVYDGRGIEPDVTIDIPEYSKILVSLVRNQFIFDYAVKFRRNNASIADAKTFALSDNQYLEFVNFVKSKDFSYSTQSKDVLDEFKKTAEKEKYFQGAEKEFEALMKKIEPKKEDDLLRFKDEIRDYLESDIVAIYYLQKGRYEHDLLNDQLVKKAIEILNDKAGYAALLKPKK